MDYIVPAQVVRTMVTAGSAKAQLSRKDILVRGVLSGALLGVSTTLAFTANLQTQKPIIGALVFPVGFVMIVLLGLELVTGNFALVPLARIQGTATGAKSFTVSFGPLSEICWEVSDMPPFSRYRSQAFAISRPAESRRCWSRRPRRRRSAMPIWGRRDWPLLS